MISRRLISNNINEAISQITLLSAMARWFSISIPVVREVTRVHPMAGHVAGVLC